MSIEGLEHVSKDELIAELINRQTFAGIVIFHQGDAKAGRLEPGEIVMTKSPPLTREGVENLLQLGQSLVPGIFGEPPATATNEPAEMLPLQAESPPLRLDEGGVIRVGNSRISLDLVVEQYDNGATPEDMVRAYDTLVLADAYSVISYYLRHRDLVRTYLKWRAEEGEALRTTIEAEHPRVSREELMERRTAREKNHAPAGK